MYLYETHLHTCQASICGNSFGHEYIRYYQDLGYTGAIITDHFVRGNCQVDTSLPWTEFVHRFCAGYEDAWEEGDKHGFQVFFGWEETFDGDDYLVYGLDKAWLMEHPEAKTWTRRDQYEQVHRWGGCVVQAHPFRDRDYISTIHLSPRLCDAFEVFNAGNTPEQDQQAYHFARRHNLTMTAGSDIHAVSQVVPEHMMGVAFNKPWNSIHDYVAAIRNRTPFTLHAPPGRLPDGPPPQPGLPVMLRDEYDRSVRLEKVRF